MSYCVNSSCPCNPSTESIPSGPDGFAREDKQEIESPFIPKILLSCGHSLCEKCVSTTIIGGANFYKCLKCDLSTNFPPDFARAIRLEGVKKETRKDLKVNRYNEDCSDEIHYDAYSVGRAFDIGQVVVLATPTISLDDPMPERPPPSHSFVDDPEVINIPSRVTSDDSFKSVLESAVAGYKECGKSIKCLMETRTDLNKEMAAAREKIRSQYQFLHGALQLEEQRVMKCINERYASLTSILESKEQMFADTRSNFKSCILKAPHKVPIEAQRNKLSQDISNLKRRPTQVSIKYPVREEFEILTIREPSAMRRHLSQFLKLKKESNRISSDYIDIRASSSQRKLPPPSNSVNRPNQKASGEQERSKPYSHIKCIKREIVKLIKYVSPSELVFSLTDENEKATSLLKGLETLCSSIYSHPPPESELLTGTKCFAYSNSSKRWCRGTIVKVRAPKPLAPIELPVPVKTNYDLMFSVDLYDYDRREDISIMNIREGNSRFWNLDEFPKLLMTCALSRIPPVPTSTLEEFKKYVLAFCSGQTLRLLIQEVKNERNYVDVVHFCLSDVSTPLPTLVEHLYYMSAGKVEGMTSPPYPPVSFKSYPNHSPLEINSESLSVTVTHIETPDRFYVNLGREEDEIRSMETELDELYRKIIASSPQVYNFHYPRPKAPCVVRIKEGDTIFFRRARVKNLLPPIVEVKLVDSGKKERVNLRNIFLLTDKFISISKKAIKCGLHNLRPINEGSTWGQNSLKRFEQLLSSTTSDCTLMTVESIDLRKHPRYLISLRNLNIAADHGHSTINEILVRELYASFKSGPTSNQSQPMPGIGLAPPSSSNGSSRISNVNETGPVNNMCFTVIREMCQRIKDHSLVGDTTLIPVILTDGKSPKEFFIQLATPEYQNHVKNFLKRLDEEFFSTDTIIATGSLQSIKPGDVCAFKLDYSKHFSEAWRRGRVISRIAAEESDPSRDPRGTTLDSPDTEYSIYDLDFGTHYLVNRKTMRKIPPSNRLVLEPEMCVRCHIEGIVRESNPYEASSLFTDIVCKNRNNLLIRVDEIPPADQPDSLGVNLFVRMRIIRDALSLEKIVYKSVRSMFYDSKSVEMRCDPATDGNDLNISNEIYLNREQPRALHDPNSYLSRLRKAYFNSSSYQNNDSGTRNYPQAIHPQTPSFTAILSEVDRSMRLYFRLAGEDNSDPLALINKTIYRKIFEKEKFSPFTSKPSSGTACTTYSQKHKRWYRSEIKEQKGRRIVVFDVDRGSTEEVLLEYMSAEVISHAPRLILDGTLINSVLWADSPEQGEKALDEIRRCISGKKCTMVIENLGRSRDWFLRPSLSSEGDLRQYLLSKDLIKPDMIHDYLPEAVSDRLKMLDDGLFEYPQYSFEKGKIFPVVVSHVVEENYVCLQVNRIPNPKDEIEEDINTKHNNFISGMDSMRYNLDNRYLNLSPAYRRGDHVVAKYHFDELWYRGIVMRETSTKQYEVLFIDYGNSEIVSFSDIKLLDEEHIFPIPAHCFLAKLTNLVPAQGIWSMQIKAQMIKEVEAQGESEVYLGALFRHDTPEFPLAVELWECDMDLKPIRPAFNKLIEKKMLKVIDN